MGKIKPLDPIIANKIAAGEVIEKLANVIKELVENAIDANAKHIDVELIDSGLKMMRVIDDGDGMDEDDIIQAFERHATSKIVSVNDLFRIQSLGFRGEAIPSIASIAKVTITSNPNNHAKRVVFDNGKFIEMKDASMNQGTMVEVEKIFHYTPARFKYLKSEPYELSLIQQTINQFALAYPTIAFRLKNNAQPLFYSNGDGSVKHIISQIYGTNVASGLITFQARSRDYQIHGMTSKPIINRSNKNYIHVIVNRRVIQDPSIIKAILESYDQMIPKQRYPITVLYIEVDPSLIDVNVHPRKQEIKFSEKEKLIELIKATIEKEVKHQPIFQEVKTTSIQTSLDFIAPKTQEDNTLTIQEPKPNHRLEEKQVIPDMDYIGQYRGTYLLFQNDNGLYMVDQHAAAERIRYERYLQEMTVHNQEVQSTIFPLEINLPQDMLTNIMPYQSLFNELNVIFDVTNHSLLIKEVPYWFPKGYEDIYLEAMIDQILEKGTVKKQDLIDDLAILLACKHSLKANHYISEQEANQLIKDLRLCQKPYTCPHGRPIIVAMKQGQIEHWFNRVI